MRWHCQTTKQREAAEASASSAAAKLAEAHAVAGDASDTKKQAAKLTADVARLTASAEQVWDRHSRVVVASSGPCYEAAPC